MFRGRVVPGDGRGRILGFPTANLAPSNGDLPADGIYACLTLIPPDSTLRGATLSVGTNPTFGDVGERRVELFIHDFSGDLYGLELGVVIIDRLRDTQQLANEAELIERTAADVRDSRALIEAAGDDVGSALYYGYSTWAGC